MTDLSGCNMLSETSELARKAYETTRNKNKFTKNMKRGTERRKKKGIINIRKP